MWVVIILFMCRHCDTVVCSSVLCEWLLYSCIWPNVKWVVIIFFMCRYCDTVICSQMLCEWLLYCSCVVTVIKWCSPMLCAWILCWSCVVTTMLLYTCNYGLYTAALSLRHTASWPRTVRAVFTISHRSLIDSERLWHVELFKGTYRSTYWLFVEYLHYVNYWNIYVQEYKE